MRCRMSVLQVLHHSLQAFFSSDCRSRTSTRNTSNQSLMSQTTRAESCWTKLQSSRPPSPSTTSLTTSISRLSIHLVLIRPAASDVSLTNSISNVLYFRHQRGPNGRGRGHSPRPGRRRDRSLAGSQVPGRACSYDRDQTHVAQRKKFPSQPLVSIVPYAQGLQEVVHNSVSKMTKGMRVSFRPDAKRWQLHMFVKNTESCIIFDLVVSPNKAKK